MIRKIANGVVWYTFGEMEEKGIRHAFLTRLGGVSEAPFDTLNLGHTVGDGLASVEENHVRAFDALGIHRGQVVSPFQVHGTHVRMVGAAHTGTVQPATDGLLTTTPGVALLLRFADCVPILLFDSKQRAVAMIHSGWKSTVGNIAQAAVDALVRYAGSCPGDLWAGIGPSIGPCCYQVGQETVSAVARVSSAGAAVIQSRRDGVYLDLPGLVQAQLAAAGVKRIVRSGVSCGKWAHWKVWCVDYAGLGMNRLFGNFFLLC
jgi:YfiH family protein